MWSQIASAAIFIICLWLIFSERLNRTIVGITGAMAVLILGKLQGFYTESQAIQAVDFNTLGLLFGMMVLIALLEPTGFFQYLAVWTGKLSRGKPVRLLVLMGAITTVLSMFLDNVTTVVLIAPITILICEILGIQPAPYLMAEAILSNTGGVSTLVGDPPNVIIASAAGFTFNDFLIHALPVVLVAWIMVVFTLRYLFRRELSAQPKNIEALLLLNPVESLEDWRAARRVLVVLGGAILLFFLQGVLDVSPAFIALCAATVALLWVQPDIRELLKRIEWSILLFFGALFVMVGALEASGALNIVVSTLTQIIHIPPMWFGVILIWIVSILSAVVDNIPITVAMIPVIQGLETHGINITPLWWALAFGAGFGGNGTLIGSTANIIVATLSEKTRTPITAQFWNQRGLPVMIVSCSVASIMFVMIYPLLSQ